MTVATPGTRDIGLKKREKKAITQMCKVSEFHFQNGITALKEFRVKSVHQPILIQGCLAFSIMVGCFQNFNLVEGLFCLSRVNVWPFTWHFDPYERPAGEMKFVPIGQGSTLRLATVPHFP